MAIYFNIIIPFQKFIPELDELMNKYSVYLYVEKWSDKRKFYYELIDSKAENFSFNFVEVQDGNLISGKKQNLINLN